jgi:hypothetical protein
MEVPADQYVTSRQVTLKPTDERIQPLVIPAVCYRPLVRENETAIIPGRVSFGVLHREEERHFQVHGDAALVQSLSIAGAEAIPNGVHFRLASDDELAKTSREITVHVDPETPLGFWNGRIRLASTDGRKCSIAVLGMVRESNKTPSSLEKDSPVGAETAK